MISLAPGVADDSHAYERANHDYRLGRWRIGRHKPRAWARHGLWCLCECRETGYAFLAKRSSNTFLGDSEKGTRDVKFGGGRGEGTRDVTFGGGRGGT